MKLTQGSSFTLGMVSTVAAVALWFVGSAAVGGSTKATVTLIGAALFGLTAFVLNIVIPVQKRRRSQVMRRRLDDFNPRVDTQQASQLHAPMNPAVVYALQQGVQNQALVEEVLKGFLNGTIVRNPAAVAERPAENPGRPKLLLVPSLQRPRLAQGSGEETEIVFTGSRRLFQ